MNKDDVVRFVEKNIDDFASEDISSMGDDDIKLNIKSLSESYINQASIIERLLAEFKKTRMLIELFMIEHVSRGNNAEDLFSEEKEE